MKKKSNTSLRGILVFLLVATLLLTMLPVFTLTATADNDYAQEEAAYQETLVRLGLIGSPDEKPEGFREGDGNPTTGKFLNLSKVPELFVYSSKTVVTLSPLRITTNTKCDLFDNTRGRNSTLDEIPSAQNLSEEKAFPVKGAALNADKDVDADEKYTAELSTTDKNTFRVDIRNASTGSTTGNYSTTFDVGDWSIMQNVQYEQLFEHYFQIVSGDFNGDGCDDIAFYVPSIKNWGSSYTRTGTVRIVFLQKGGTGGNNMLQLGSYLDISISDSGFGNASIQTWESTPGINLSVANLNKDSSDDLAVIRSWTNSSASPNAGRDSASTLYIYDKLKTRQTAPSFNRKLEETGLHFSDIRYRPRLATNYTDTEERANVTGLDTTKEHTSALTAATAVTGSVVSAESNELVIAGYSIVKKADGFYSDRYIPFSWRKSPLPSKPDYHNPHAGIAVLQYDFNGGSYEFLDEAGSGTDGFSYKLIDEAHETLQSVFVTKNMPAPMALTTAKLLGSGNKAHIVADGFVYNMNITFGELVFDSYPLARVRINGEDEMHGERMWSKGKTGRNEWIKQSVAGNVTGDPLGHEHVYTLVNYGVNLSNPLTSVLYEFGKGTSIDEPVGVYFPRYKKTLAEMDDLASGFWASLCLQDVDSSDGMVAEFKGRLFTYTEPKVLAVLAAAPYFSDLADADVGYSAEGETAITALGTEGDSHEANVGVYNSTWGMAAGALGPFTAEAKIGFTESLDYTFTRGWSQTKRITRTNDTQYDQVVIASTPVDLVIYEITVADGETFMMSLTSPYSAREAMIPVSEYDKIAEKSPSLPVIGGKILRHTEGDPGSYHYSKPGDVIKDGIIDKARFTDSHYKNEEWAWNKTNSTMALEVTKDDSHTIAFDIALWASVQATILVGAGTEYGAHAGYGFTHFNSKGTEFSGYVPNISRAGASGHDFDFQWGIRNFEVQTKDAQGHKMNFLVLTYETKDVSRPIYPPTNLEADEDAITMDTITLNWEPSKSGGVAAQELQYRMKGNINWTTVDGSIGTTATTYTHTGLNAGRTYEYRLRALKTAGSPLAASLFTPICEAQTKVENMPSFDTNVVDCALRDGQEALFSVKVKPGRGGQVDYQWQELNGSNWVNIADNNKNYYSKPSVSRFDDGRKFRCIVTETDMGISARIISHTGEIKVLRDAAEVELGLSATTGRISYNTHPGDEIELTATVRSESSVPDAKSGLVSFVLELLNADPEVDSEFITVNGNGNTVGNEYIATAKFTPEKAGEYKIKAIYHGNAFYHNAVSDPPQTYIATYPAGIKMLVLTDNAGNEYFERISRNVVYGESVWYKVSFAEVQSNGSLNKTPLTTSDVTFDNPNFQMENDGDSIKFTCINTSGAVPAMIKYNDGSVDYAFALDLNSQERPTAVIPDSHVVGIDDPLPALTFAAENAEDADTPDGRGFLPGDKDAFLAEYLECVTFDSSQRGTHAISLKLPAGPEFANYDLQLSPATVKVANEEVKVDFAVEGGEDSLLIGKAFNLSGEYEMQLTPGGKAEKGMRLEFSLESNDLDKHVEHWIYNNNLVPASQGLTTFDLEGYAADIDLVAVMADTRYVVNYAASESGGTIAGYYSGTEAFDSGVSLFGGTALRFAAAPDDGFVVKEWRIDGVPVQGNTSNELTIADLRKDITVFVVFEPALTYAVTFGTREGNGSVTAMAGNTTLESGALVTDGTSVTFTAKPMPGQLFRRWYINGTAGVNTITYTTTVAADTEIMAAFASIQNYTVTYSAEQLDGTDIGTVSAVMGASPVLSGASVGGGNEIVFTAALLAGKETTHKVSHWIVNGETVKNNRFNTYTHYLNEALTVTAVFAERTLLTYNADDIAAINGMISGNGLAWTPYTDSTYAADPGWPEAEWSEFSDEMRVTSLTIANAGLTGNLNISGLAELEDLQCGDNLELTGLTLGTQEYLQTLASQNCPNLTGTIDASGCQALGVLSIGDTAAGSPLSRIQLYGGYDINFAASPAGSGRVRILTDNLFGAATPIKLFAQPNTGNTLREWTASGFSGLTENPDGSAQFLLAGLPASPVTVTANFNTTDTTPPTGKITVNANEFTSFLKPVTFGLFFKGGMDVTITANDGESGVKRAEYYLSATDLPESTDWDTLTWTPYTTAFSVTDNRKVIVYARLTDNGDNAAVIRSEGVVLYTDSAQDTASISFVKGSATDVTADVRLNGNTLAKIMNGTATLTSGTDYTVSGNTITFKAAYLERLAANNYTLTVHYNPQGVAYVDAANNDIPAATTIALTVGSTSSATYPLTVNGGTGSGSFAVGAQVSIIADPAPTGKIFDRWTGGNGGSFADATAALTTFTMPGNAATITATYKDPPFGTILVTEIKVTGEKTISTKGGTSQLTATVTPENATNKAVTWSVINGGDCATVSETGLVTAKANGTVTIRATAQDGSVQYGEITISVTGQGGGQPAVYAVLQHFGTWTGSGTATGKVDADYAKFVRLLRGGQVVDPANYSVTSGSTVITLTESYLKTLANGEYTYTAEYTDGTSVPLNLTVNRTSADDPSGQKGEFPDTDDSGRILWLLLGGVGLVILGGAVVNGRRKKRNYAAQK